MKIILNSHEVEEFLKSIASFYEINAAVLSIRDLANKAVERETELFAKINRIERELELKGKR